MTRSILLLSLTALCCCAAEVQESSGHCSGAAGPQAIDDDLFAEESYFYRDDQHGGVEHAFVDIVVGDDASRGVRVLSVKAHLADMPDDEHVGEHPLLPGGDADGFVDGWDVVIPRAPAFERGALQLVQADRTLLVGALTMAFTDDSEVSCDLELARSYRMDTDD